MLKRLIEKSYEIVEGSKYLGRVKPLIETVDGILFSSLEVAPESPYLRDYLNLKRLMLAVVIAVFPLALASVYFYGWRAVVIIVVSYISGGLAEVTFDLIRGEEITEGFLVTGILYPLILPPTTPLWMVALGAIVGVIIGKQIFGGTGYNIFNPALVGRVFLTITFPTHMSTGWIKPLSSGWGGFTHYSTDAITTATPLTAFRTTGTLAPLKELLLGTTSGCLGETCGILIILGGLFLIYTKVSDWRIPLSYLGTVLLLSSIGAQLWPGTIAPPLFQLFAGGLLFGAVFMATDPVTCPTTVFGRWIFGISLGILTLSIRAFSSYPEGVMFSILFMNMFSPLIDELTVNHKFGPVKKPY